MIKNTQTKLCLVSSAGGHLYKITSLKPWWKKHPRFFITDPLTKKINLLNKEKVYYAHFPVNRHLLHFFKNFFLALKILKQEKPTLLFSLGAGIAPPFFIAAKILKIKTVFMETFILSSTPTLSGRLIYPFADHFLIQNKKLNKIYPKAEYWGQVL